LCQAIHLHLPIAMHSRYLGPKRARSRSHG